MDAPVTVCITEILSGRSPCEQSYRESTELRSGPWVLEKIPLKKQMFRIDRGLQVNQVSAERILLWEEATLHHGGPVRACDQCFVYSW